MTQEQPPLFPENNPKPEAFDANAAADAIRDAAPTDPYVEQHVREQAVVEGRDGEDLRAEQTGVPRVTIDVTKVPQQPKPRGPKPLITKYPDVEYVPKNADERVNQTAIPSPGDLKDTKPETLQNNARNLRKIREDLKK